MSTGINIYELDSYTRQNYGFRVLDWDNDRDGILVQKFEFVRTIPDAKMRDENDEEIPPSLENLKMENIAKIFNVIIKRYNTVNYNGKILCANSLNMNVCNDDDTILNEPFIFIMAW